MGAAVQELARCVGTPAVWSSYKSDACSAIARSSQQHLGAKAEHDLRLRWLIAKVQYGNPSQMSDDDTNLTQKPLSSAWWWLVLQDDILEWIIMLIYIRVPLDPIQPANGGATTWLKVRWVVWHAQVPTLKWSNWQSVEMFLFRVPPFRAPGAIFVPK